MNVDVRHQPALNWNPTDGRKISDVRAQDLVNLTRMKELNSSLGLDKSDTVVLRRIHKVIQILAQIDWLQVCTAAFSCAKDYPQISRRGLGIRSNSMLLLCSC